MTDPFLHLAPEERLLLSLCWLEFTEKQKNEISELMNEVKDWDRFVRLSNEHGIIALCWYNIVETGNGTHIPADHLAIMHSAYFKSLCRNAFLYQHLTEVASIAKAENIKVVLLKGMVLEKVVYKNMGLRQMSDIDILVRKDQAALLRRVLLKNGYTTAPLVSVFHEKIMPVYGKHLPEMYRNGVAVEIHFNLFDQNGGILSEEFLNKATRIPDTESNLYYPEYQLFFLYLVKHLEKHERSGFSQLRLYTDLAVLLLLYADQIINEKLFEYAVQANLEKILAEKLAILQLYWNISITRQSKSVVEGLKTPETDVKFLNFLRHPGADEHDEKPESLGGLMKKVPGLTNKLLLVVGHVFPSLEYIKYRYKIKTTLGAALYYPVRWAIQAGKLAGTNT